MFWHLKEGITSDANHRSGSTNASSGSSHSKASRLIQGCEFDTAWSFGTGYFWITDIHDCYI